MKSQPISLTIYEEKAGIYTEWPVFGQAFRDGKMQLDDPQPDLKMRVYPYEGGVEMQIERRGRRVSVCRSERGVFDVLSDDEQYLYTGRSEGEAMQAMMDFWRSL